MNRLAALLCTSAIIGGLPSILLTGCSSTAPGNKSTKGPTATAILESLGVKEVNSPPAATVKTQTGSTVTVDPSTWQPLKRQYAVFSPRAEIFQAGGSPDGQAHWNSFYEDAASAPPYAVSYPITDDQSWEKSSAKTSVAADLGGNGLDDIVVFYAKSKTDAHLYARVYVPGVGFGDENVVSGVTLNTASGTTAFDHWIGSRIGIGSPWLPYLSCTKADLDGSGTDAILLADYESLYVLSVATSGAASVVGSLAYTNPISSVASGDYNGDGKDEFVVGLQGGTYSLYNADGLVTSNTLGGASDAPVEAAFGNFAGNNLDQLALCTTAVDGNIAINMYDFSGTNGGMVHKTVFEDTYSPFEGPNSGTTDAYRMVPRAVDLTGNGTDQLEVLGSIYSSPMTLSGTPTPDYQIGSTAAAAYPWPADNTVTNVGIGDVDNDAKQDVIVLSVGENSVPDINVFGLDSNDTFVRKTTILAAAGIASIDSYGAGITLAVGNFEDNSARVHYVGHKLTFTDPIVIAALASPPYWHDIVGADPGYANAYSGWNTTFGETQANSTDTSTSVGFSVGCTVEFEHDVNAPIFGFTIAKFKASVAFKNTNTWEWSNSYEVSKTVQYNCPGGQNMVIFTSVPMDQYEYQIDYSNDPINNPVGKHLYINIPRQYSTYFVSQDFFNSHIGSGIVQPVDSSVFGHTVGDPTTYPSASQKDALMSKGFQGHPNAATAESDYQCSAVPVAQGSNNVSGGSTNLEIALTNSTSESTSHDFSLDTEVGAGVGDITVLATAGFQVGYSATSTVSTTTTFGGTVGYLPTTYYNQAKYQYSAGIFVYPYAQSDGNQFWVLDYYVQAGN